MPTPILSPYVARGRSSYRNAASGDHLYSAGGVPSRTAATMCCWFVRRGDTNNYAALLSLDTSTGGTELWSLLFDLDGTTLGISNGAQVQAFAASPAADVPFFCAVTSSPSGITGYWAYPWDFALQSAAMVEGRTDAPEEIAIAGFRYSLANGADVNAWNVRVFNRALSARELLREMRSPTPLALDALNRWYPLEGNTEQLLRDYSGNGRHLTRAGTPRAEPFFLPANVLMPLVDDAAVDAAGGGGTTYQQALSTTLTAVAALSRGARLVRAAANNAAATQARRAELLRSAGISASALLARSSALTRAATTSAAATQRYRAELMRSASAAGVASSTRAAQLVRVAGINAGAALARSIALVRAAASSAAATQTAIKTKLQALAATVAATAGATRVAGLVRAAAATASTTVARGAALMRQASATTAASATRTIALVRAAASSAAATQAAIKSKLQTLAASVAAAATLRRGVQTVRAAVAIMNATASWIWSSSGVPVRGSLATYRPTSTGTRRPRATGGTRPRNTQ